MSKGDLLTQGNQGKNFPFQHNLLLILGQIATATGSSTGGATEVTLQALLTAVENGSEYEAKLVVDSAAVPITWLEVRVWNTEAGTFDPPIYYAAGSNTPGSPTLPISYINPTTILSGMALDIKNDTWDTTVGNDKLFTYYAGAEAGHPATSTTEVKTIQFRTGGTAVFTQTFTYDAANNVLTQVTT